MNIHNLNVVNGNIFGKRFKSSNSNMKHQVFDKTKIEDCTNIDKISISSISADINVLASTLSKDIKVHFSGEADMNGNIDFDVSIVKRTLKVQLKSSGTFCNSSFKLDIFLPGKTFKEISFDTISGDIDLGDSDISVEYLESSTTSGCFDSRAKFKKASIRTTSGNIDLYTEANQNISIEANTISGNVWIEPKNINDIELYTSTISGTRINNHHYTGDYKATIKTYTVSGDVTIN